MFVELERAVYLSSCRLESRITGRSYLVVILSVRLEFTSWSGRCCLSRVEIEVISGNLFSLEFLCFDVGS